MGDDSFVQTPFLPPRKRRVVEIDPKFHTAETRQLSEEQNVALTVLVSRLRDYADMGSEQGTDGVRALEQPWLLFADGVWAAPLSVFYRISEDDEKVLIIDVLSRETDDVQISPRKWIEVVRGRLPEFRG